MVIFAIDTSTCFTPLLFLRRARAHALVSSADPLCTNCEREGSRRGARCLELAWFLAFESRSFSRVFRRLERSRSRSFYEE